MNGGEIKEMNRLLFAVAIAFFFCVLCVNGVIAVTITSDPDILLGAMIGDTLGVPVAASYGSPGQHGQAATHTGSLGTFSPVAGSSFTILSSGDPTTLPDPDVSESTSYDWGQSTGITPVNGGHNEYDGAQLLLMFTTPDFADPSGQGSIGFTFQFLSEEYQEYVGSSFNDYFAAFLGTDTVGLIHKDNNISFDTNGNPITVNNNFGIVAPTGTERDGATPVLETLWPVMEKTDYYLAFRVADASDHVYDSEVFLDNFRISGEIVDPGTNPSGEPVPEPGTLVLLTTGLAGLAGYGKLKLKRRKRV